MAEYLDAQKGRCATCGLLAVRSNPYMKGEHYWEAELERRQQGNFFHIIEIERGNRNATPACLVREVDFKDELGELWSRTGIPNDTETRKKLEAATVSALNADRRCSKWFAYAPGLSPKEHLQDCRMLNLEQRRQEFETRLVRNQRRFDIALFAVVLFLAFAEITATIVGIPADSWVFGRSHNQSQAQPGQEPDQEQDSKILISKSAELGN